MKRISISPIPFLPCLLFCCAAFGQVQYTIIDLGRLPGAPVPPENCEEECDFSRATGLNNRGEVVGYSDVPDGYVHAFIYRGGMTDLGTTPLPPGWINADSYARALNEAGQVVGEAKSYRPGPMDFTSHGFISGGGGLQALCELTPNEDLCGTMSFAYSINRHGHIVGNAVSETYSDYRAFVFDGTQLRDLGSMGGRSSLATGINDDGQIVGSAQTSAGSTHAFRLNPNETLETAIDLGTLGGSFSYAAAINKCGNVVGDSWTASDDLFGFFWSDVNGDGQSDSDEMVPIRPLPGGVSSSAKAVNGFNQVVGCSYDEDGKSRAFLWDAKHGVQDLNSLVGNPGWEIQEAAGINDRGQIAGTGIHNGKTRAFLLSPVITCNVVTADQLRWYLLSHAQRGRYSYNPVLAAQENLQVLIDESLQANWDARFLLAIAGAETVFGNGAFIGTQRAAAYNFWNIKCGSGVECVTDSSGSWRKFQSFRDAVRFIAQRLHDPNLYSNETTVDGIGHLYVGLNRPLPERLEWMRTVKSVMSCLGYPNACEVGCVSGSPFPFETGDGCFSLVLDSSRIGNLMRLAWPPGLAGPVLESSASLTGPWAPVNNQSNPYEVHISGPTAAPGVFYRLLLP